MSLGETLCVNTTYLMPTKFRTGTCHHNLHEHCRSRTCWPDSSQLPFRRALIFSPHQTAAGRPASNQHWRHTSSLRRGLARSVLLSQGSTYFASCLVCEVRLALELVGQSMGCSRLAVLNTPKNRETGMGRLIAARWTAYEVKGFSVLWRRCRDLMEACTSIESYCLSLEGELAVASRKVRQTTRRPGQRCVVHQSQVEG